jgi:2-iminobutanoate/2-iminopropanoate deaminase
VARYPVYTNKVGIHTPAPIRTKGLWSLGVKAGDFLFTAGQPGVDADGRIVGDTTAQARQALENLKAILEAGGFNFGDVAKIRIFLRSTEDYESVNAARIPFYREHFPDAQYPASTALCAPLAVEGLDVEIEAVACRSKRAYDVDSKIIKRIPLELAAQPLWRLGVETEDLLWTTGQPGLDVDARLVGDDAASQTLQALHNACTIVQAGGFSFADVVKLTTYLADASDSAAVDAARRRFLAEHADPDTPPAVTTVQAQFPPPGMLVEVECVAASGDRVAVSAPDAASRPGSSQAIRTGRWIFLEGQGPFDRAGRVVGLDDMDAQVLRTLENVEAVLRAAGAGFADIVHQTIWIQRPELYEPLNEARVPFYRERFPDGDFPASTAVVGRSTAPDQLLSMEVIAYAG